MHDVGAYDDRYSKPRSASAYREEPPRRRSMPAPSDGHDPYHADLDPEPLVDERAYVQDNGLGFTPPDDPIYNQHTESGPPIELGGDSPYVSFDEPVESPAPDYDYVSFDDPPRSDTRAEHVPHDPGYGGAPGDPVPWIVLNAGTPEEEAMRLETDVTIGRGRACTIRVKDSRASRQHCRLFEHQGAWWLEDLGSANGTLVNGDFVAPETPQRLAPGDQIVVGSVNIRFERDARAAQFAL